MRRFHPTRALLPFLAVAALTLGLVPTSYAEDPEGPDAPAVEEDAPFNAYDIALAKGALPEGWAMLTTAEGSADQEALMALVSAAAKAASVEVDIVSRSASKGDKKATFVLADLTTKSEEFVKALEEQGKAKGFAVRKLGAPTRVLVVQAPEDVREEAVAIQTKYAARMLGLKAQSAFENRGGPQIRMYARAALLIDPKSAPANLYLGMLLGGKGAQDKNAKLMDRGITLLKAALAKDATFPLAGRELAVARGELGGIMLQKGGASPEARDVLKEAVKGLADVDYEVGMGFLYNLACAHGRLKELDEAFASLTKTLEQNATKPVPGISHWPKDPDFDNLKADPRWAELTKKYETAGSE